MKTCEVCGKEFTNHAAYYRHRKVHSGRTYQCHHCGKTFTRKYKASQHEKAAHPQQAEPSAEGCQAECFDAIDGEVRRVSYSPGDEHARDPVVCLTHHRAQILELLQTELQTRRGLKFYLCVKVRS
jgi:KRAB domain-containing zinc finger protein